MASLLNIVGKVPQPAHKTCRDVTTPVVPVAAFVRAPVLMGHASSRTLVRAAVAAPAAPPSAALSSFASIMDEDEDEDIDVDDAEVVKVEAHMQDETLKVENLGLSPETVAAVHKRGIVSLFPIQKSVFAPAMEGRDLIGRAKTGSGKTLAFALPVVEGLLKENKASGVKPARGRPPRAIILAPTRELANQVAREFETVCPSLTVVSVYGGVSIGGQCRDLERGADVVVGTPGRIIDLIEREKLVLDKVRYAILDEADQMLDMGFEEDMENILGYVPEGRQTLLFSATLPKWVNKVARRFQVNPLLVDLVGEENTGRLADTIRLLVTQVEHSQKMNALLDAITLHAGSNGKAIVFVNTKLKADEICEATNQSHACVVLHGDVAQAQRDRALKMFRDGKAQVLVATDVAARGLDIPSVDLVVHYDVPLDCESFLHRSGRTGRAGKTGTAVVLFTDKEVRSLGLILRQTKVESAELQGAPEPKEVLGRCARSVLGSLDKVEAGVVDFFVPAAEKLLASEQPSRVLAAALAALGGFRSVPQPRSLLTYEEGSVTCRLMGPRGAIDGWNSLNKTLKMIQKKARVEGDLEYMIGKVKLLEDKEKNQAGAAFDLPVAEAEAILAENGAMMDAVRSMGFHLDRPRTLPLDVRDMANTGESRGSSRGYGRDSGSRGGYGRDRGGSRGGYGGGYGRDSGSRGGYGDRTSSSRGGDRDSGSRGGWGDRDRNASSSGRSDRGSYGSDRGSYGSDRGASRGAERAPARGASRSQSTWSADEFYDAGADGSYFNAAPAKSNGAASAPRASPEAGSAGKRAAGPQPKGGWAQW